jgi:hypothetical protein
MVLLTYEYNDYNGVRKLYGFNDDYYEKIF